MPLCLNFLFSVTCSSHLFFAKWCERTKHCAERTPERTGHTLSIKTHERGSMTAQQRPGHRARPQARARGHHGSPETHALGGPSARKRTRGDRRRGDGASGRGREPTHAHDRKTADGTGRSRSDALAPAHVHNSRITQSAHVCGQVGGHGSRYTERTEELVEAGRIDEKSAEDEWAQGESNPPPPVRLERR